MMTFTHSTLRAARFAPRALGAMAMAIAATFGLVQSGRALAQSMPQYFATPEQAGQALVDAVREHDDPALQSILGPDGASALSSGDADEDASAQKAFVRKYDAMHRWATLDDGSDILYVGADNYPYPFPLKKDANGWRFDGLAGSDEMQARRIGSNELLAIDAINALALAEEDYHARVHQYTARILSRPGTHDGLYWVSAKDELQSPLGDVRNLPPCPSCADGSQTFDGYVFRVLDAARNGDALTRYTVDGKITGGFALIATPVAYGKTGIMSFVMNRDGTVYEKDLGASTEKLAAAIRAYDVHDGWTPAE